MRTGFVAYVLLHPQRARGRVQLSVGLPQRYASMFKSTYIRDLRNLSRVLFRRRSIPELQTRTSYHDDVLQSAPSSSIFGPLRQSAPVQRQMLRCQSSAADGTGESYSKIADGRARDAKLGVLGGGQLGRMLALAAVRSINSCGPTMNYPYVIYLT